MDYRSRATALHNFVGPPGTGKTMLAELISRYGQAMWSRSLQ
ncbi:MAG: AAA family ATPase [Candidatus Malihini olakiniferum]